jgi:hypothetical protein
LSAIYGMCEDRDIGHMAHFLRCGQKAGTTPIGYRGAPGPRQMLAAKGRAAGRVGVQRGLREDPCWARRGGKPSPIFVYSVPDMRSWGTIHRRKAHEIWPNVSPLPLRR